MKRKKEVRRDQKKTNADIATGVSQGLPTLLTGHIDLVQIRNGAIHILDYKPNAAKGKPIEQLTWYALALSRQTGLRVFCFKCAWFDEKDYFDSVPFTSGRTATGSDASETDRCLMEKLCFSV